MLPVVAHEPAEEAPLAAENQEQLACDTQGVQLVILAQVVAGHEKELIAVDCWPVADGVVAVEMQ